MGRVFADTSRHAPKGDTMFPTTIPTLGALLLVALSAVGHGAPQGPPAGQQQGQRQQAQQQEFLNSLETGLP